jgi:hypothetical protein
MKRRKARAMATTAGDAVIGPKITAETGSGASSAILLYHVRSRAYVPIVPAGVRPGHTQGVYFVLVGDTEGAQGVQLLPPR